EPREVARGGSGPGADLEESACRPVRRPAAREGTLHLRHRHRSLRREGPAHPAGRDAPVAAPLRPDRPAALRRPHRLRWPDLPYNVLIGPGIQADLEHACEDALERGAVITSLLPAEPVGREERQQQGRATNGKVLDAFRSHLDGSGLSQEVVERDLANVAAFAECHLLDRPEPVSLRQFSSDEISGYVTRMRDSASLTDKQRREAVTSLKRLLRFLRDTGRMDHDDATHALDVLAGR